jgi:hypothetical protein
LNVWPAVTNPLRGRTSLARVVWVYGLLGSVLVSLVGLFLDTGNEPVMRIYAVFGLLYSVYVAVATWRCAANCRSAFWAVMARISAVLSLLLLPVFAYLEWAGALDLSF